jgi:hypothetical protein
MGPEIWSLCPNSPRSQRIGDGPPGLPLLLLTLTLLKYDDGASRLISGSYDKTVKVSKSLLNRNLDLTVSVDLGHEILFLSVITASIS